MIFFVTGATFTDHLTCSFLIISYFIYGLESVFHRSNVCCRSILRLLRIHRTSTSTPDTSSQYSLTQSTLSSCQQTPAPRKYTQLDSHTFVCICRTYNKFHRRSYCMVTQWVEHSQDPGLKFDQDHFETWQFSFPHFSCDFRMRHQKPSVPSTWCLGRGSW